MINNMEELYNKVFDYLYYSFSNEIIFLILLGLIFFFCLYKLYRIALIFAVMLSSLMIYQIMPPSDKEIEELTNEFNSFKESSDKYIKENYLRELSVNGVYEIDEFLINVNQGNYLILKNKNNEKEIINYPIDLDTYNLVKNKKEIIVKRINISLKYKALKELYDIYSNDNYLGIYVDIYKSNNKDITNINILDDIDLLLEKYNIGDKYNINYKYEKVAENDINENDYILMNTVYEIEK